MFILEYFVLKLVCFILNYWFCNTVCQPFLVISCREETERIRFPQSSEGMLSIWGYSRGRGVGR